MADLPADGAAAAGALPHVVVARGTDAIEQSIDGDTVVYVASTEQMVLLDPVATQVWDVLAVPQDIEELVELLAGRFGVPADRVARDLTDPFETLVRSGVLTASVEGSPEA